MRIGIGYDVHRLVEGRKLILGGVTIPHPRGLLGHSDADVLLHAVCDALLGAAGLGDIGQHFSDKDPRYAGVSSLVLLEEVLKKIKEKNFKISNVDTVLIAEEPKIGAYRAEMQSNMARVLQIQPSQVNIKATTEEGLGFTGKKEGIAAWATVILESFV